MVSFGSNFFTISAVIVSIYIKTTTIGGRSKPLYCCRISRLGVGRCSFIEAKCSSIEARCSFIEGIGAVL